MQQITLLLADDHAVVRQGLRALLEAEDDMKVVGEAENGLQAVQMVKRLKPDVALLDVVMPSLSGLDAARQIKKDSPKTKVLILSSYNNEEYVQQLAEIGGAGYLVKQTAARELVTAIREVIKGNVYFSAGIANPTASRGSTGDRPGGTRPPRLSPREREVLRLIAEGNSNRKISQTLVISIKTVEKHRQQVMNKLNIHDVASLTRYALAQGIIDRKVPAPAN
jgi:DNA-binding NarL/FixJ family response regulator